MNVFSVTQLNRHIRNLLEHEVGEVCVEGEISHVSQPTSGHLYFTLKDATAQLRCVFFRNRHTSTQTRLDTGQHVLVRGTLSLYEARGDYQLIVEELNEAGQGDLHRLFELLKAKLAALGLFEFARKRRLPRFPQAVGVITSASGAALRDILTTLARRFPHAAVLVYPSDVQGKLAASQLSAAIQFANHDKRCDVLILARGGGSIDDLWAFNDEALAYTIAESEIPIVTGIGHETDFTIADFVADWRAATPTAAAEAVTPDQVELLAYFQAIHQRVLAAMLRSVQHKTLLLRHTLQNITSPGQLIATHWQTLDYLERHLHHVIRQWLMVKHHQLHQVIAQLQTQNPRLLWLQAKTRINGLHSQLVQAMDHVMQQQKQRLHAQLATLHAVSPLATLERGYAIVTHDHRLIIDSTDVERGDVVDIRLAKGRLMCEVLT